MEKRGSLDKKKIVRIEINLIKKYHTFDFVFEHYFRRFKIN